MNKHLDRVRAERDLRNLNVELAAAAASQGDEKIITQVRNNLISQLGVTIKLEEKLSSREEILKLM